MFNLIALLAWLCVMALMVFCIFAAPILLTSSYGIVIFAGAFGGAVGLAISVSIEA